VNHGTPPTPSPQAGASLIATLAITMSIVEVVAEAEHVSTLGNTGQATVSGDERLRSNIAVVLAPLMPNTSISTQHNPEDNTVDTIVMLSDVKGDLATA